MPRRRFNRSVFAIFASCAVLAAAPAKAVDGVVLITQARALAGLMPGDAPGFPVTITQPGSYRLAGNLLVPADKEGIVVNPPYVSIDLNGFEMDGGGVATIGVRGTDTGLEIRNGTIHGFKSAGISCERQTHTLCELLTVEDMRIADNAWKGVAAGNWARIVDSTILRNGYQFRRAGLACGDFCRIEGSTISHNGGEGVVCNYSCHVEGSIVSSNGTGGSFSGIEGACRNRPGEHHRRERGLWYLRHPSCGLRQQHDHRQRRRSGDRRAH